MRNSEHKTKPVSLGFQGGAPSGGGEQGRVRPGTTSVCYPRARFRSPAKNWNLVQPVELAVRSETLSAECLVRLPDAAVQTKRPCRPLRGSGVARSTLPKSNGDPGRASSDVERTPALDCNHLAWRDNGEVFPAIEDAIR